MTPLSKLTSTRFIADTNVAIELINDPERVKSRLAQPTTIFVPTTVLGELFFGAWNSTRREQNLASVERFAAAAKVLVIDLGVSRRYGEVRKQLEAKGRRIPENDLWIAATAIMQGLPPATRERHFKQVDGLEIIDW